MLATAAIVRVVAAALEPAHRAGVPIVLDPVFGASLGGALLDDEGIAAIGERLLALARVITPNASEAARLTGLPVGTVVEARQAAARLVCSAPRPRSPSPPAGGIWPGRRLTCSATGRTRSNCA